MGPIGTRDFRFRVKGYYPNNGESTGKQKGK